MPPPIPTEQEARHTPGPDVNTSEQTTLVLVKKQATILNWPVHSLVTVSTTLPQLPDKNDTN
jgi:hypothetical protein